MEELIRSITPVVSINYIRYVAKQNLRYSLLCQSFLYDHDRPYKLDDTQTITSYLHVAETIQTWEN